MKYRIYQISSLFRTLPDTNAVPYKGILKAVCLPFSIYSNHFPKTANAILFHSC